MAQQLERAKEMKATVLLNLRGQGIMLKRLPITMLKKCGDPEAVVNAALQQTCNRKTALGWNAAVRNWGRNGLSDEYLDDLLAGLPFVKHPNFYVALQAVRVNGAYQTQPVGFIVYGTFNPERFEDDRRWRIDIDQLPANRVNNGRVAEIEGIIVRPPAPGGARSGLGRALMQWAIADIASRRKGGQPRYRDVVLNTTNDNMLALSQQLGFLDQEYRLVENGVNRRNDLIARNYADNATWLQLSFTQDNMTALLNAVRNRVVSTNACPVARGGLRMWPMCR